MSTFRSSHPAYSITDCWTTGVPVTAGLSAASREAFSIATRIDAMSMTHPSTHIFDKTNPSWSAGTDKVALTWTHGCEGRGLSTSPHSIVPSHVGLPLDFGSCSPPICRRTACMGQHMSNTPSSWAPVPRQSITTRRYGCGRLHCRPDGPSSAPCILRSRSDSSSRSSP